MNFSRDFIELACDKGVLRFGSSSPRLGDCLRIFQCGPVQRRRLVRSPVRLLRAHPAGRRSALRHAVRAGLQGHPLVAGTAMRWPSMATTCPSASNPQGKPRTTAKAAPGGRPAGRPRGDPRRRDSAGTSVRESVEIIRAHGATPSAVVIALDRMERGTGSLSAVRRSARPTASRCWRWRPSRISSPSSTTARPRCQPGRRPALPRNLRRVRGR